MKYLKTLKSNMKYFQIISKELSNDVMLDLRISFITLIVTYFIFRYITLLFSVQYSTFAIKSMKTVNQNIFTLSRE